MKRLLALLALSVCLFGLIGCGDVYTINNTTESSQETSEESSEISEAQTIEVKQDVVEGEELMCLCENEQEAKEIAKLYEIEFVYFANGVATFTTDKDLGEVIQKGKDNGWTELSVNHVIYLDDPVLDPIENGNFEVHTIEDN